MNHTWVPTGTSDLVKCTHCGKHWARDIAGPSFPCIPQQTRYTHTLVPSKHPGIDICMHCACITSSGQYLNLPCVPIHQQTTMANGNQANSYEQLSLSSIYSDKSLNSFMVPPKKCDCGGAKAQTTHSSWCSTNGDLK